MESELDERPGEARDEGWLAVDALERELAQAPRADGVLRSRTNEVIAATQSAATAAAPTGRVSPASEASRPAVTQRPVSTA